MEQKRRPGMGGAVHCGERRHLSVNRPILKASRHAEARLRWHMRFYPWMLAKRRRVTA